MPIKNTQQRYSSQQWTERMCLCLEDYYERNQTEMLSLLDEYLDWDSNVVLREKREELKQRQK